MAEFLTTQQTSAQIEQIIREARKQLVLVSPYLQISRNFMDRLIEADANNVKTFLIYRENKLKPDEREKLASLNNLDLFACDYLHAKCYFNETNMVITSMNFYEVSEKNNREMGIWIDQEKPEDYDLFNNARKEVFSILRTARKEDVKVKELAGR